MIARFQTTGDMYDSRNRRWLFSTPRAQAESTRKPVIGKTMRTARTVSGKRSTSSSPAATRAASARKPAASTETMTGASQTPSSTRTLTAATSRPKMAPANRPASWRFPSASRRE